MQAEKSRWLPQQQETVRRTIVSTDQDISRLLTSLAGNSYRNTIAEVVTKDFGKTLTSIRQDRGSLEARPLGFEVEVNRDKVKVIQQQLQNIYNIALKTRFKRHHILGAPVQETMVSWTEANL